MTPPEGAARPRRRRAGTESLRRRVERLLGFAILTSIVLFTLVGVGFRQIVDARNELIDRVDASLIEVTQIQALLSEQQSALRGLAISRVERFAESYDQALAEELEALDRLTFLTAPDVPSRQATFELRRASEQWHAEAVTVAILEGLQPEQVTPQVVLAGELAFDRIEVVAQDAAETLQRRQTALRADLTSETQRLAIIVMVAGFTLVALAIRLWLALRRDVLAPLGQIAIGAAAVAAGDLRREVVTDGPPEIQAMAEDVEAMRRRMLADIEATRDAQVALEQQAQELREQAQDLERSNSELERFAYVASHDLQEPLRKVASFCELLQRRYGDQLDDRAETYISYAVDGAHRMQALIQDLLEFSRVGRTSAGFEPTSLTEAATTAMESLSLQVEDNDGVVEIGELPTLLADPSLMTQLFQNLIGNAIKFRGEAPPHVRLDAERDGDDWCFHVTDNGIGIAPEYADQVFELFQRLHERDRYEGTGIGLALCRKIVEFHGGRIWIDPDHQPGTRIHFTIPALSGDDEPAGEARP